MSSTLPSKHRRKLRDARLRKKWTQETAAERLQAVAYEHGYALAGADGQMVSKWERGEKGVSLYYKTLLCLLYECEAADLDLDDDVEGVNSEDWGERLRRWREREMQWSRSEMCEHFTAYALQLGEQRPIGPDEEISTRQVARWETGDTRTLQFRTRRVLQAMGAPVPRTCDEIFSLPVSPSDDGSSSLHEHERATVARAFSILHEWVFQNDPAIADDGDDSYESADMNRRQVLRVIGATGALLATSTPLPSNERASADILPLEWSDELQIDQNLWALFTSVPSKRHLLPIVQERIQAVSARLERVHSDRTHRVLCELLANLFQLAGEIFFDANRYTEATHCYTLAASASKEVNAYDLWACALTRNAFVAVYERQFSQAAPLLDFAGKIARRGDSTLSTRYWVAAVQAEAYAGMGELEKCRDSLEAAERVQDLTGAVHNGGWLRFDSSRLAEQQGTCYVELGRPDLAESALLRALDRPLTVRRRASAMIDLAAIGARRKDVEQVTAYTSLVLQAAHETGSGVIGSKLRTLQPRLTPLLADSRIRELDDGISALDY